MPDESPHAPPTPPSAAPRPSAPWPSAPRPAASPASAGAIAALVVTLSVGALRNRWKRRLARLRKPRYALTLLAGAAYLWFVIGRQTEYAAMGSIIVPWAETLTALGFTLLAATWWLAPSEMGALAFTPPEAHLLFPAPVTRRALLVWKLLRAQGTILVSTVLWVALLRGGATTGGWLRGIALWGMFSTIHLHRLAVQLSHASRRERHDGVAVRGWTAPVVLVGMGVAIVTSLWAARDTIAGARTSATLGASIGAALDQGPAAWVLAPARAAVGPLFATAAEEWPTRAAFLVLVLLAHYAWVFGRDVAFEESAMAASTALADRVAESQRASGRRRRRPVTARGRWVSRMLGATGPAAVAIAWKNVLGWVRSSRPGPVIAGAVVFGAINVLISGGEMTMADLVTPMAIVVGVLLVLFGPGIVRADLRQDLAMLEIVRGWPLTGRAVFGAEVAASTVLLLALQLGYALLVLAGAVASGSVERAQLAPREAWPWALALLVGLAALDFAHLSLYNLVAVLFPDWVRPDRERMGGIEATGQSMLLFFALLVALSMLLVVPTLGASVTTYLASGLSTVSLHEPWEVWADLVAERVTAGGVLASVVTAAVLLLVETMGLLWWGGRVLDRMEPLDTK